MCIICVHLQQEKITLSEAVKNLNEMVNILDEKHVEEVKKNIYNLQEENFYKQLEKFSNCAPHCED
jgi:hypothetical protein